MKCNSNLATKWNGAASDREMFDKSLDGELLKNTNAQGNVTLNVHVCLHVYDNILLSSDSHMNVCVFNYCFHDVSLWLTFFIKYSISFLHAIVRFSSHWLTVVQLHAASIKTNYKKHRRHQTDQSELKT